MTDQTYTFTVEIAGIPVEICCRYEQNRIFVKDYLSDKAPLIHVNTVNDNLAKMQDICDKFADRGGLPHCDYSDSQLENMLIHAKLINKLSEYNILMLHSSALCMDGKACLFAAPSGTGKSTHVRLWREVFGDRVRMINDDKPLIKITDDSILVCGNPWNGKHSLGENISVPLKAIVRLRRGAANHIAPLSKSEAMALLLNQAYKTDNVQEMKTVLSLEMKLLEQIEFYSLTCNMDAEAAVVAWQGIYKGTFC